MVQKIVDVFFQMGVVKVYPSTVSALSHVNERKEVRLMYMSLWWILVHSR